MNSEQRQKQIIETLQQAQEPCSGNMLAKKFGVTRQVIVKDMGIIKASGTEIVSTAKGYILKKSEENLYKRKIVVCHTKSQIEQELNCIVDFGGVLLHTQVNHPIYGSVGESLRIKSRKDIRQFLQKTEETGCMPLLALTNGIHTHIIAAEDIQTLDEICETLKQEGFLVEISTV